MKIKEVNLKTYIKILSSSLMFLFLAALFALPASAALQAVSPATNPGNGFPLWYQDENQLALGQCLTLADGTTADPNCGLLAEPGFNPAQPIVFPTNFPGEFFYWTAESDVTLNATAGSSALVVLAMEAAFLNEIPQAGNQSTFGRIRVRIISPDEAGTYIVTHPFGVTNVVVVPDAQGRIRTTTVTDDIGCFAAPCDFSLALGSGIGPFLTAVAPAPPAGYIGDALTSSTVTGSPTDNNLIRVQTPGGAVVENNHFVVSGKLADTTPPVIVSTNANPPIIEVTKGTSLLNTTVTDDFGVRMVTVDLSALGLQGGTATLSGEQEVPPSGSTATGTGTFALDTGANTLSFNIQFSGLTGGAITGAHIHGPALPGSNVPPIFDIQPFISGSTISGVWNYPEDQEANITADLMYVNIHTTALPGGEIRGQILITSETPMMLVSGSNTNGVWQATVSKPAAEGDFLLPVTAVDGTGNTATGNISLKVVPAQITLTADQQAKTTRPGVTATYVLTLTNTRLVADNFTLNVINVDNASIASLDTPKVINLASGAAATVNLDVASDVKGMFRVDVMASSEGDSANNATVSTTTTVTAFEIANLTVEPGGTRGGFIKASVDMTNLGDAGTFVIDVSGVAANGFPLVGTATVRLAANESIAAIPVRIAVPPGATPGNYNLIAGAWTIDSFPDPAAVLISSTVQTVNVV